MIEARKPTSRRWVQLPSEFIEQVQASLRQAFPPPENGATSHKRTWTATGFVFPEELCLRAGYLDGNGVRPFNFEVSMDRSPQGDARTEINCGLDLLGALFEKHFAEPTDDSLPPLTWTETQFEGRKIYFRHTSVNDDLEKRANELLGQGGAGSLVQGDWEDSEGGLEM